jgi:multimeric flavodoxin WrbA
MSQPAVRKGMPPRQLERPTFEQRFKSAFADPVFAPFQRELQAITDAAWDAYDDGRKAPVTRKAGPGFADPDYDIAVDWMNAHDAIEAAKRRHDDPAGPPRILIVNGSSRTEHTCPGEMSKSWRLVEIANETFKAHAGFEVEILDLSRTTSEFGKTIHPCKSCVSTSMALCHWPCSCYPNYSLGQVHDWMNEIYPLWVAAHGILVVTPVNWYQAPGPLKAMMDRLVCADGGNPDPSSTHGKVAAEAKALELEGWPYPRHSPAACSRSWRMATRWALKRCAAHSRIGRRTCTWWSPVQTPRSTVTSAISSHTRPATKRSIEIWLSRPRSRTPPLL